MYTWSTILSNMEDWSEIKVLCEYSYKEGVGKQMPDGIYLVLVDRSIYKGGTFDMMKTIAETSAHVRTSVPDRGCHKMITAEDVLMFTGEVKGYVVKGHLIEDQRTSVGGYLLGPLHMMAQKEREGMMSCLCRGMGHITKDMWYIYQCKRGENKSDARTFKSRKMPAAMRK